jgi:hypothetical protein
VAPYSSAKHGIPYHVYHVDGFCTAYNGDAVAALISRDFAPSTADQHKGGDSPQQPLGHAETAGALWSAWGARRAGWLPEGCPGGALAETAPLAGLGDRWKGSGADGRAGANTSIRVKRRLLADERVKGPPWLSAFSTLQGGAEPRET